MPNPTIEQIHQFAVDIFKDYPDAVSIQEQKNENGKPVFPCCVVDKNGKVLAYPILGPNGVLKCSNKKPKYNQSPFDKSYHRIGTHLENEHEDEHEHDEWVRLDLPGNERLGDIAITGELLGEGGVPLGIKRLNITV
ncbi:MAG: hypothetical protein NTW08_01350 [Gammaproteobacteria bacterium]|nr:hypothetical protein [Gammaproteobacteria bacterium]